MSRYFRVERRDGKPANALDYASAALFIPFLTLFVAILVGPALLVAWVAERGQRK